MTPVPPHGLLHGGAFGIGMVRCVGKARKGPDAQGFETPRFQ